ncbi:MAG TPA: hypothetical protein DEP42_04595 [Ruminococcaceae bacterium]|nr:hypothetical protein [Oscillospiraceae bacterium]
MRQIKSPLFPGLAAKMAMNGHDDEYVAECLDHSVDYFRRRKNGVTEFSLTDIKKLMNLYGCEFDDLFCRPINQIA